MKTSKNSTAEETLIANNFTGAAATARKLQNLGAVDGSHRGFTAKSVEELVENYGAVEATVGTTSYVVYSAQE